MNRELKPPSLWPCLKQIERYLDANRLAIVWYQKLEQNEVTTLSSAANLPSEEWLRFGIPLRVLVELRAIYKSFTQVQAKAPQNKSRRETLKQTKDNYQSFEDLSAFVKSAPANPVTTPDTVAAICDVPSLRVGKTKRQSVRKSTKSARIGAKKIKSDIPIDRVKTIVSGKVNIIGRLDHPNILIRHCFSGNQTWNVKRPLSMTLDVYGKEVALELRNASAASDSDCNVLVLVFARNNLRSYTKLLDKFFHTIKKDNSSLENLPILLVGVISDGDVTAKSKYVLKDVATEGMEVIGALRYIEVTSNSDAKGVFLEISRILIRDSQNDNFNAVSLHSKLQKLIEKKAPELSLKKKNLSFVPNSLFFTTSFLQRIRLDHNLFQFFPLALLECTQLRELSISNNVLEELPNGISKLTLLTHLNVENNRLESLPIRELQTMRNLQELKTSGNPLTLCPGGVFKGKIARLELIQNFEGEITNLPRRGSAGIIVSEKDREPFKVFGVELQDLMSNEYDIFENIPIPRFVRYSMNFILARGIYLEGIFRVAGQTTQCNELINTIDSALDFDFSKDENPHNVTSLLKQWLRDLPEPVLLFDNFIDIMKLGDLPAEGQIAGFVEIMKRLPMENYHLLRQMFRLMYITGVNCETNRMDYGNVAKVVAPNLAFSRTRDTENPMETISRVNFINDLFTLVAESYPSIFEHGEDLFKIDYLQDRPACAVFYRKYSGHSKSVTDVIVTSDKSCVWTADTSGAFRIWNIETLELLHKSEDSQRTCCVIQHCENVWLGTLENLQIRKEISGELVQEIQEPTFNICSANNSVWSGSENGYINIYDTTTFEKERLRLDGFVVLQLVQVNDTVWGACTDRKIRIWNIESRECVGDIEISGRLNSFTVIDDNVWGAFDNACVVVWNASSKKQVAMLDKEHTCKVFGVAQVGNNAWTYAWDGSIHLYDINTFSYVETLPVYTSDAIGDVISVFDAEKDCYKVFTVSWDKTVTVWLAKK